MKKFNMGMRAMTPAEIKEANTQTATFGPEFRVTGGSCEQLKGGRKYNLCLGYTVTYNRPLPMLKDLATRLKTKTSLDAKEIWYMGIRLV